MVVAMRALSYGVMLDKAAVPILLPPDPPPSDGVVTLRLWRRDDVPRIVAACRDEELLLWLDQIPSQYDERVAREWLAGVERWWREGTSAGFAIADASDDRALGSITLAIKDAADRVAEVGYWLAREERGRGAMTRALRLLARWALDEVGIERLYLRADPDNGPSCAVAERAGFAFEGVHRSAHWNPRRGKRVDFRVYSLLPGELS
jgi:RimJ/RimL family protein N-acetyltransferase